ncbi:DUF2917 domain-containing protein [Cupriavidus necator]|uniref:DUF2917 domain-containing protein n=1 Tax=Cupriavidus necator TaxID=106590 RepID=A0A1U9UXV1_CUPNE|nr:DUF2917 domain-containing protein [Cupriavidus necator]AQV97548.1 DUF2917 domain-containing protein [Cupriavidus necator]
MKPSLRWRIEGRAPIVIRLAAGDQLRCVQGLAWVTQAPAKPGHDPDRSCDDFVLGPRARLSAAEPLTCFVSALCGKPAWIVVSGTAHAVATLPPCSTQPLEANA